MMCMAMLSSSGTFGYVSVASILMELARSALPILKSIGLKSCTTRFNPIISSLEMRARQLPRVSLRLPCYALLNETSLAWSFDMGH